MKEMKNKLYAFGCSWTDSSCWDFQTWPDIVGNYFDLNVFNLGYHGRGNSYILNTLTDALYEGNHNVSAVMILWSGQDRINVFTNPKAKTSTWNLTSAINYFNKWKSIKNNNKMKRHYHSIIDTQFDHSSDTIWEIINSNGKYIPEEFLRTVYQAQKICDINNVPMICMCGTTLFGKETFSKPRLEIINQSKCLNLEQNWLQKYSCRDEEEKWTKYLQTFLDCKYYDWVEDNVNFLGFPIYPEIGGWDVTTGLYKDGELRTEGKSPYRVSIDDSHPNAKGQEVIANEFIKAYKEILS